MASIPYQTSDHEISRALGDAAVRIWGLLPPDIQQHLFEEAASHEADSRSRLALFLHGKHPRTCASLRANAMVEPDSLGG
jgi:hypothetical protein